MTARLTILLTAIALLAGVAGCGDDDSSGTSGAADAGNGAAQGDEGSGSPSDSGDSQLATTDLSKEEYAKRANAICAQNTEERFEELTAYGQQNPDADEDEKLEGAVEDVIAPSMVTLTEEIRELGAPKGDEQQVERIVAAFDRVADVTVSSEGDLLNQRIAKALREAREAARGYGLNQCRFK